ncbi:MAG: hypothetical protein GY725_24925, partial [bacterium]|nr:hypothetical protein [bacterium]
SEVAGPEHQPILAALEGLVAARIIEPSSNAADTYRFSHALIRETLYRGIHAPSRARFHESIAAALERLYSESTTPPLAELAHHWYLAVATGAIEKAAEYCERAGLLAASRLAFEEAVTLLRRASELADLRASPDDSSHCELLLQLGQAEWSAAEQTSARASFARAAALARQVGSAALFARAAIGYYGFEEGITADSTTLVLLEEAAKWIGSDSPALRASVLTKLQHMVPHAYSMETQRSMSLEVLDLARNCGEIEALREAFRARHNATLGPDFLDERLEWEEECRSWGKQLDDPWLSWFGNDVASP